MSTDKNALCKAMGTLFLQHRVQCLESDVRKMHGSSEIAVTNGESSSRCPLVRSWTRGWSSPAAPRPAQKAPSGGATRVIVVDASVLIYSMRSVHEWRKMGDVRVVIPDEAICTLDVLKNGDEMINMAARKAARYIEDHMVCDLKQAHLYLPGLRPQMDDQKLAPAMAPYLRLSQAYDDGGLSPSSSYDLSSAPVNIRETVLGALWYQQDLAPKEGVRLAIAVAFPPDKLGTASESASPYEQRVDGRLVVPWLKAYGFREKRDDEDQLFSIEVVPTASSWLKGQRDADEKNRTRDAREDRLGRHGRERGHERGEDRRHGHAPDGQEAPRRNRGHPPHHTCEEQVSRRGHDGRRHRNSRHEEEETRWDHGDRSPRHRRHEEEEFRRTHDDRGHGRSRHKDNETARRGHEREEVRHQRHDVTDFRRREHHYDGHREHRGHRHLEDHSERHCHSRHANRSDRENQDRDARGGRHHHGRYSNDDATNGGSGNACTQSSHLKRSPSISSTSDSGSASDEVILVEKAARP